MDPRAGEISLVYTGKVDQLDIISINFILLSIIL